MILNTNRNRKSVTANVFPAPRWASRLFRKPLKISVQERELKFADCREFDFSIAARTAVPALRLGELLLRPAPELDVEADNLRNLALRLTGMLEDYEQHGLTISGTLRQTGVMMISKDHDWRAIFGELADVPASGQHFVAAAVRRYIEYLTARQDILKAAAASKYRDASAGQPAEAMRTSAFDATIYTPAQAVSKLRRLPRGEAVLLKLEQGRDLLVSLARHRFALTYDQGWALVGDDGQRYSLKPGVNSVGRSRENNVPVNSRLRNISRRHLIAEPRDRDRIVLTDVSTGGTFVAPTALAG